MDNINQSTSDIQPENTQETQHSSNLLFKTLGTIVIFIIGILVGYMLWGNNNRDSLEKPSVQTQVTPSISTNIPTVIVAATALPSQPVSIWKTIFSQNGKKYKTANNWTLFSPGGGGFNPKTPLQEFIAYSQKVTQGNYLHVYWKKEMVVNGYKALVEEVYMDPTTDSGAGTHSLVVYIVYKDSSGDAWTEIWGIPPIPDGQKNDTATRFNQVYIDEFINILSTFTPPTQ